MTCSVCFPLQRAVSLQTTFSKTSFVHFKRLIFVLDSRKQNLFISCRLSSAQLSLPKTLFRFWRAQMNGASLLASASPSRNCQETESFLTADNFNAGRVFLCVRFHSSLFSTSDQKSEKVLASDSPSQLSRKTERLR